MGNGRMSADTVSGRQISVAVLVAGLSPAAAAAGEADWFWILVWSAVAVLLAWLTLRRTASRPLYRGAGGTILYILYAGWSALMAARVLSRAVRRLEMTSGGSSGFWLLLLVAVPLLWMAWGKAAPFFRSAEIFWLAMAALLVPVAGVGITRVEWSYVAARQEDWLGSALAAGEIFVPALFVLPYIYNVEGRSNRRGLAWLTALGGLAALLSLVTVGILGEAARQLPNSFFAAAGTLGRSARCEGLLSVLWLLPDLVLAGLLCRAWGDRWRPMLGGLLVFGLALSGIGAQITREICVCGTLGLLLLSMVLPGRKGKIVVDF